MPLFVPILRLLMLFLNVYDSYKTLKIPPPSSRNGGRPSVRALSQRKRDMKGVLAVWIVWVALSMYERMVEGIICLLIPFYNEFKSLALLFLILTRARGAEPIYLHLIRPLVKPYTGTLDGILDLMLMVGDFIFALSMYPVHLGLEWWQRLFTGKSDGFVTVQESTSSEYSSEADISDAPSSLLESSAGMASSMPFQSRRKPASRRSTGERTARDLPKDSVSAAGDGLPCDTAEKQIGSSNFLEQPRRSGSPSRRNGKARADNPDPNVEPDLFTPLKDTMRKHQIWHPPTNSSDDDEDFMHAAILKQQQKELDEWRQYPAFPSAYPPTPLAVTATLVTAPLVAYPTIEEEQLHQDFRPSLLPPREPLNPSHAADTSDVNFTTFGNSPSMFEEESVSSDISDDEDQFNITLQTPLPAMRSLRSQSHVPRPVSILSELSVASVGSRASALTTSDVGSPLRTHESVSDSSSAAPKPADSIPIIGKKRAYPRNDSYIVSNRVRQIEEEVPLETSGDDSAPITSASNTHNKRPPVRGVTRYGGAVAIASAENEDPLSTSSNDGVKGNINRPAPPEEKRRKVIRASAAVNAGRPVTVRSRVARQASA